VNTKSPQPEVFRSVKRMDVLDGASVSVESLFSQAFGMRRHRRDPIELVRWEPVDGDRSCVSQERLDGSCARWGYGVRTSYSRG
jgi:hypothetical protein